MSLNPYQLLDTERLLTCTVAVPFRRYNSLLLNRSCTTTDSGVVRWIVVTVRLLQSTHVLRLLASSNGVHHGLPTFFEPCSTATISILRSHNSRLRLRRQGLCQRFGPCHWMVWDSISRNPFSCSWNCLKLVQGTRPIWYYAWITMVPRKSLR